MIELLDRQQTGDQPTPPPPHAYSFSQEGIHEASDVPIFALLSHFSPLAWPAADRGVYVKWNRLANTRLNLRRSSTASPQSATEVNIPSGSPVPHDHPEGFFRLKCEAWDFSLFCRSQSFCYSMYQETSLITEGPWLGSPSMSTFLPRWKSPVTSGIRRAMAWRCGGPCPYDAAVKNVATTTSPTSSSKQSPRRSGTSTCGSSPVSGFTKLPSIAVAV